MKATITFHPLQNDLFAYSGGELPPEVAEEIRLHLEDCALCRSEVVAWEDVRQRTADHFQSLVATAAPPADAWSRIQAEVARPVGVRPIFGGSLLTQAATIALVGVLLLMVGVGVNTIVAGSTGMGFVPLIAPPPTQTIPALPTASLTVAPPTLAPTIETESPAGVPVLPHEVEGSVPLSPMGTDSTTTPTIIPASTNNEPLATAEPSPTPRPSHTATVTSLPTVEPRATLVPTPTRVPPTMTAVPTLEPTPTAPGNSDDGNNGNGNGGNGNNGNGNGGGGNNGNGNGGNGNNGNGNGGNGNGGDGNGGGGNNGNGNGGGNNGNGGGGNGNGNGGGAPP